MELSIRKGETLELTITNDDITAQTVQFLVSDDDGNVVINQTANFSDVDDKWTAVISTNNTNIAVGTYKYMYKIVYSDGDIDILPESACEDCELPAFNVCESIAVS